MSNAQNHQSSNGKHTSFRDSGYLHIPGVIEQSIETLCLLVEEEITRQSNELGVSISRYLSFVSAWGKESEVVRKLLGLVQGKLATVAMQQGLVESEPADATPFIKSQYAPEETHAHQDISYRWNRPELAYTLTTWLALDDCDERTGALSFLPTSHHSGVEVRQDFLAPVLKFMSKTELWRYNAETVPVRKGDVIVFDARTRHAAKPFEKVGLRRALAVRWTNPELLQSTTIPKPSISPSEFGMDTSGRLLVEAIGSTFPEIGLQPETRVQQALKQIFHLKDTKPQVAHGVPSSIWSDLERLQLALLARQKYHARPHSPAVWEPTRDRVIPAFTAMNPLHTGGAS